MARTTDLAKLANQAALAIKKAKKNKADTISLPLDTGLLLVNACVVLERIIKLAEKEGEVISTNIKVEGLTQGRAEVWALLQQELNGLK